VSIPKRVESFIFGSGYGGSTKPFTVSPPLWLYPAGVGSGVVLAFKPFLLSQPLRVKAKIIAD
jgi:hypothetical protein